MRGQCPGRGRLNLTPTLSFYAQAKVRARGDPDRLRLTVNCDLVGFAPNLDCTVSHCIYPLSLHVIPDMGMRQEANGPISGRRSWFS
jgi:hypothetical protein